MTASLVLASTSPYRRQLLERLRLPFTTASPRVDELPRPGESPRALAQRLAIAKAEAVAKLNPAAWVIGADQVAECDDDILGKPGTADNARMQLSVCSGRVVTFHTAVRLMKQGDEALTHVDVTRVKFRVLTSEEIERYVELDQPLDCAGSFRSEGLGIVLFERIETDDPTALVGLPLLWVANGLRKAGFDPLTRLPQCL
ncbi:MAG: Maf family protein [Steroidobacteraceae bacterium]|jgi:septum formation protein|nr:Maf family protein [Steroidobacteraceae bacterium]